MSAQIRVLVDRLVLPWGLTNSLSTSVDAESPPTQNTSVVEVLDGS